MVVLREESPKSPDIFQHVRVLPPGNVIVVRKRIIHCDIEGVDLLKVVPYTLAHFLQKLDRVTELLSGVRVVIKLLEEGLKSIDRLAMFFHKLLDKLGVLYTAISLIDLRLGR